MSTINSYVNSSGQIVVLPVCMMKTSVEGVNKPIAIRLTIDPQEKIAFWEDTTRGHSIRFIDYKIGESEIAIIAIDNSKWTFTVLTKENFDSIKKYLNPMDIEFKSDREIQEYYLHTNFSI